MPDDPLAGRSDVPDPTSLMGRLKATTQALHDLAENRELQRRLVKGALPREQYVAYLAQLYLVHRGLEQRIREAGGPAFEAVLRDYHWRDARLTRIFEGTSEIQQKIISDSLLPKPPRPAPRRASGGTA